MVQRRSFILGVGTSILALSSWGTSAATKIAGGESSDPIRIIVPYPPGGPLDVAARTVADAVSDKLGKVIVDNRSGAGGGIGMGYAKRQKGDGRTWVIGAVATHAINPFLYPRLPYDPLKDFKPVTLIAHVPNVLVVSRIFSQKTGIRDFKGLIRYLKKHPGEVNYASGGSGSAGHLAAEWMKHEFGVDVVHIPFNGAVAAQYSLLASQTDLMFDNLASCLTQIEAGALVPIAVTSVERNAKLPSVPTMIESGVENFDVSTWYGVFVPSGTSDEIVGELNRILVSVLDSSSVKEKLDRLGGVPTPTTPEDFSRLIDRERKKYEYLIKLSDAKVD